MLRPLLNCVILFATLFISSALYASAHIDSTVREFLNRKSAPVKATRLSGETLRVLVLYKENGLVSEWPHQAKYHEQVELKMKQNAQRQQMMALGDLQNSKNLWLINGTAANLSRQQIFAALESRQVVSILSLQKKVSLDNPLRGLGVDESPRFTYGLTKLAIPDLLLKYPTLTGQGVRVGILDSGIDSTHPDLKDKVVVFKDFTKAKSATPSDGFQHGTHVAGTIAGGHTSGQAIGAAPEAQLVIGKIFDGEGASETEDILQSMQWIADPDGDPKTNDFPLVVNSSWGDPDPYDAKDPQEDPFCRAVSGWVKLGMIPVFSAGNSGAADGSVGLPAGCPEAFSVGATNINDQAMWFSSAGPAKWKSSQIIKPEIVAPGWEIISAKPDGGYQEMSGTSMAAPHITGAFALLLQAKPSMTVEETEKAMIAGAKRLAGETQDNTLGWGRPDVLQSVELLKK